MINNEYTPLIIPISEVYKNEKLDKPIPTKNLNFYLILVTILIILSSSISYIFNLRQFKLPKSSYLTGIPFLRTNYFLVNLLVFIILYTFSVLFYFVWFSEEDKRRFKESFLIFNKKLRYFYCFHNLVIYIIFIGLYNLLYQPLFEETKFRLSGHVLITLFSSNIMINFVTVIDLYKYYNISHFNLSLIRYTIYFLLIHNLYVIIWTSGYFHTFLESIFSLCIGLLFLLSFDYYSLEIIKKIK